MVQAEPSPLRPLEPSGNIPLSDELYLHLRDAIRSGQLVAGQRLVEDAIANATGISRTPVREALRMLVANGLAVSGGRGLIVAQLSSRELQELWEVMASLWVTAVRLATENRTAADLAEMSHIVEAEKRGDGDLVVLNERFRSGVLRAARNRYLTDTMARIVGQAESLVDLTSARRRADLASGEAAIFEAIERQDVAGAENATREHLSKLLAAVLIEMSETQATRVRVP